MTDKSKEFAHQLDMMKKSKKSAQSISLNQNQSLQAQVDKQKDDPLKAQEPKVAKDDNATPEAEKAPLAKKLSLNPNLEDTKEESTLLEFNKD